MRGLEGVRVVELGHLVSASFASKLLADLGADVVKVEEAGGDRARARGPFPAGQPDPEQSGLFLYLNANKRGVSLDLDSAEGQAELERLVAGADILLHNYPAPDVARLGLDYERLRSLQPALVVCAITPFGLDGPYRDYRAEELNTVHAGGWGWLSPGASEEAEQPPLKAFGHQADFQGALAGATAALAAFDRAERTGQGEHIDLSVQAYVASLLEAAFIAYTYAGVVATRMGQRGLNPWGIYRCSDGLIFVATIEADQWDRLVEFMGRPEWAELEIFADFPSRLENHDALRVFLQEWIATWTVEELYRAGQEWRICFAPVLDMAQLAERGHLVARDFFVDVEHPRAGSLRQLGPPYQLRDPWWRIDRPAPLLGQHNDDLLGGAAAEIASTPAARATPTSGLPLEGVRVLDLTWVWAGPFCAMHLAHLGAEVIKVESESRPDLGRRLAIFAPDAGAGLNRSGYFNQWNQGKKSISLDLSRSEALDVVRQLIRECDVLVDNFATGVMERLGLGQEELFRLKPDLVVASISGYGSTGPDAEYMAYGPAIAPLSGLSSLSGYPGGEPREVGISLGDPTAGITAALGICAALVARTRNGGGQHIDVSLWESTAVLVAEGWMDFAMNGRQPERMGNRDPVMAPHGCFRCAGEDDWISIACASDEEWRALCGLVNPDLAGDPRFRTARDRKANEDELDKRISQWCERRDRWDVTRDLQAVGVPAFPSLTPADLAVDPQLEARGFFARLEHPEVGVRQHAGIPWRLANGPNGVRAAAPVLGAHTDEILRTVLGYSDAEIERMRSDGILS